MAECAFINLSQDNISHKLETMIFRYHRTMCFAYNSKYFRCASYLTRLQQLLFRSSGIDCLSQIDFKGHINYINPQKQLCIAPSIRIPNNRKLFHPIRKTTMKWQHWRLFWGKRYMSSTGHIKSYNYVCCVWENKL